MNDSLDLLDLLLNSSEYCNLTDHLDICLENPKNYYIEHDLDKCSAPNKHFEAHQHLLYTLDNNGKEECLLEKSYKSGFSIQDIEFINKLIKNNNNNKGKDKDVVYENVERLNKECPEKLEKAIIDYHDKQYFGGLKEKITKAFSENKGFKYSNKLLKTLQKELSGKFNIAGYTRYIIDIFITQAAHYDEGNEYFKIVVDYAKENVKIRGRYLGSLVSEYQEVSRSKDYSELVYEDFIELSQWLTSEEGKDGRGYLGDVVKFISDAVSSGKYYLTSNAKEILTLIYKGGINLSENTKNEYCTKFSENALKYGEIIEIIVENESSINQKALNNIVHGAEKLIKSGKEENVSNAIYLISRAYKQNINILDNDTKAGIIDEATKLGKESNDKLKKVIDKFVKELGDIEVSEYKAPEKVLSSSLEQDIKEAINKADLDFTKLKIRKVKVAEEIKYLYEKLGWKEEELKKYLERFSNVEEQEDLIRGLELIYEYRLGNYLMDRKGNNVEDILINGEKNKVGDGVLRLYKDNNIYYPKDTEQIIKEIEDSNEDYKLGDYLREQLNKISYIEDNLDREIDFSYSEEIADNLLSDQWYLYSVDHKIFLKGLDYKGRLFRENLDLKLSNHETEGLKNILLYQQPYHPSNIESAILAHHKVKLSAFKDIGISEDSIPEAVVWLKKAMHLTVLGEKYEVRDAQIISLLNLYKGGGGRLLQVSTGEGKTIIIAMFAALGVAQSKAVDIITSSKVLAIENEKEQQNFYEILGITSAHNIINSDEAKNCYKLDVVYGDLLHFIGDDLRDTFKNVKYGRGYDIVIADEVDNMFIDNINMKVQLSAGLPGFHYLRGLKIYSWIGFKTNLLLYEEEGGQWYFKGVDQLIGNEDELNKHLDQIKDLYIAGLIIDDSSNYYFEENGNRVLIGDRDALELNVKERIKEYQKTNIHYNESDGNYYYKAERKKIGDQVELTQHLKNSTRNYIKDSLLNLDEGSQNRLVNIPRHLDDFMREHSGQLAESIIIANNYRLGTHYKISNPEVKQEKITPVDYLNTGVIQLSLTWSDGLHQYIELKHGLNIRTESLTNIFRSYIGYFLKYEGSIYGLTGTLGEEEHHKYLNDLYKVDNKLMPNYVKKNLERFKPTIVDNRADWEEEVSNQAIRKGEYNKRGVLIICKTINEVNRIYEVIKSEKAYKGRVMRYSDSGYFDESIIQNIILGKMKVAAGDIIVATNLAGRGTDLKIEREVNKNGGLHVILTHYPDSIRVEAQAFGRGARNGDYGSASLVIEHADKDVDMDYLGKARDIAESKRLEDSKNNTVSQMKSQDELFDRFVDLVAKINSPTGFEIVRGNPHSKKNGNIYVYKEHAEDDQLIHIKCYKPENTSHLANLESSEVSNYIKKIDEKSYNHLIDTLSNSLRSFNQRDNELIHYFASEMGCIENNIEIKERVDRRYCSAIKGNNELELFKLLYDKYCSGAYKSRISEEQVNKEKMQEFELIRHKEKFKIWERDRELYNYQYEIEQLKENWAIWLKNAGTFGPKGLLGWEESDKKAQIEKLNKEFKAFADKQLILFKNDLDYSNKDRYVGNNCQVRESKEYKEDELLMKNPSYLVQKSRYYITQHYNKEIQEDYQYKKNHFKFCKGKKNSGILPPQRSISYAIDFAERGIELDYKFAWSGYNMLAITKLIRDGEWIKNYEDAESAARVKQEFYTNLATTRNSLESYIIPKQSHECGALIISQVTEKNADTVKQCLFILKSYEKISKHLEKLMDTVAKAKGDEMIRPSRMYGAEEILNKIDSKDLEESLEIIIEPIEATQEKEKLEKEYNEKNITKEEYEKKLQKIKSQTLGRIGIINQENLFNEASKMEFRAMTEDLSHDLNLLGFLGYDIEVYELDKDWTDTIIAGILAIATLGIGIAMLPLGGFLGVMGTSLITQSVLELVQIGISIDKGIPINLDQFIKSKGIGVAVAIITAGIAKGLESSGIVAAKNIPGFRGLEKGATTIQKTAFIKTGVLNALEMSAVMGAVDAVSRHIADKYMKKNDGNIEEDIKKAIEAVLSSHNEEITKILLNDEFNHKLKGKTPEQEIRKIVDEALKIITNYASQGTARQMVSGVAGKVSSFFGPIPGAIANLADAAVGYTKASEAVDKLQTRLKEKISEIASKAKATKALMEEKLMQDFPKDAKFIMEEINGAGLLINDGIDIDYSNCNRYNEVSKKSGKNITGECEYIAKLREKAKEDKEKLKNRLIEVSLDPIRGIYTREVAMPIVKGELVDPIVGGGLRKGIQYLEENIATTIKKPTNTRLEDLRKDEDSGWGLLGTLAKKGLKSIEANKAKKNFENYRNEILRQEIEKTIQKGQVQYEHTEGPSKGALEDAQEKWDQVLVKKGNTVWGIYNNNPTQKQLEEFVEMNPYIAARGVKRDDKGNIIHLKIRAGEKISVPKNIAAASYKGDYTPAVQETKNNLDDSQVMQDVSDMCLVTNSMDKYGNVLEAQDATPKCADGACPTNTDTATFNMDNIYLNTNKELTTVLDEADNLIGDSTKISDREKAQSLRKEVEVGLNNWLQEKWNKVRQGENIVIKLSDGSAVIVSYGLKNFPRMSVDGFAMACPSCYLKVKKWGDNIGAEVGDILKWIDGKLTENKYTNSIYVNGKKLTVGVFRESSENSPETLKTFLEVLTLTGGGKVTGKIGEKATTGSIELGGKLKDGAKKIFTKADDVIKPNTPPATDFESKTSVGGESSILDKYFGGKIKLTDHEGFAHGGHTKDLHVGLKVDDLKARIANEGKNMVTSYPSEKVAENVISEVLSKSKNVNKIEKWLKNTKPKLEVSGNLRREIGYGVNKNGEVIKMNKATVILIKTKNGIKIETSHPIVE